MKDPEQDVGRFTAQLRRQYADEIDRDPRAFKKRVVRLIRRDLPPKRGRPTDPRLDEAARMLEHGKPVRDVLRWLVPDYDRMDALGQYLSAKGLRAALARRRRHRAQTNPAHGSGK